jgi:hypothetical protein
MLALMKRWQNWLPSWLFACVLGIGLALAPFAELPSEWLEKFPLSQASRAATDPL